MESIRLILMVIFGVTIYIDDFMHRRISLLYIFFFILTLFWGNILVILSLWGLLWLCYVKNRTVDLLFIGMFILKLWGRVNVTDLSIFLVLIILLMIAFKEDFEERGVPMAGILSLGMLLL